ncbi:MAG: site-2 protease family protein [Candidatus Micrarchaeia archaeon]|jgi:membrane-associated protease RseP (regulator of RpoE activity)
MDFFLKVKNNKNILTILIILISLSLFIFLLNFDSDSPVLLKFGVIVLLLAITGIIIQKLHKMDGGYGILLIRTKKGLELIDTIAKKFPNFWKMFADIGLVWGFGVLGFYFLIKNSKESLIHNLSAFILGLLLIFFTLIFVMPLIAPLTVSIISNIDIGAASQSLAGIKSFEFTQIILMTILILGGFSFFLIASLILYSGIVILNLVSVFLGINNAVPIEPSGTLLLPGINLPFFEGIIALVILLLVHEASHGFLSRLCNPSVKLDSGGLAFFGFIPMGAFIDPDEKDLNERKDIEQTRVMVAGSTANIFTMIIAFILLSLFIIGSSPLRESGYFVIGGEGLPIGTEIYSVDGKTNLSTLNLTYNQSVIVLTDKGEFIKNIDEKILYSYATEKGFSPIMKFKQGFEWLTFVYTTLALILILNFFVGIMNLIPLPILDGYHIIRINIKNKNLVKGLMYITIIGFISNFIPWIFK